MNKEAKRVEREVKLRKMGLIERHHFYIQKGGRVLPEDLGMTLKITVNRNVHLRLTDKTTNRQKEITLKQDKEYEADHNLLMKLVAQHIQNSPIDKRNDFNSKSKNWPDKCNPLRITIIDQSVSGTQAFFQPEKDIEDGDVPKQEKSNKK